MTTVTLILVLGGPGAGKSTVSTIISNKISGCVPLKSGQIVRKDILTESHLSERDKDEINQAMQQGCLVKDDIVSNLIHNEMQKSNKEKKVSLFVLDGFPRTSNQIISLMQRGNYKIALTLFLNAPNLILEKRCKLRNLRTDRIDDRKGPVESRINEFVNHYKGIRQELEKRKCKIVEIDTCEPMELMTHKIVENLTSVKLL